MKEAERIINALGLEPHPEGGYFIETYRSVGEISQDSLDSKYQGKRNYATCIYFLLTSESYSTFHRIHQDEIWHFYDGSPIKIHIISETGDYSNIIIGRDVIKGEKPQFVVPGNQWFAAEVINDNDYTLVGCTVSPGFDFTDFQLANRKELITQFPQHEKIITKLTNI